MRAKLKSVDIKASKISRPGTLFDPTFVYMKGADVQRTWRRYGWKPPSEYRSDYEFKKNREGTIA